MKGQFIIQEPNFKKKGKFIEYILDNYKVNNQIRDCRNKYPLVIDFDEKIIYTLESITCCACAAQNKRIISINHFKKIERK